MNRQIQADLDALNSQQRAAVLQMDGPILILAGPGSGKTRVITQRIANIIAHDVPSYGIAALTFTNKAAEEMKNRLDAVAPSNQVWCGTFHRFCSRMLRAHASLTGLKENFSIFDSGDSKKLIKQAIIDSGVDLQKFTPDRLANKISQIKNAGVTHEQFQPKPGVYLDAIVAKVYPLYQQLLRLSNGVDFDDLLLLAVDLLRNSPELREALDRRYAYMLVDEYQDTNSAQYQLVRLLNHNLRNLTATGDPDQSIYGWRGANLNNILHFEQDYPDVRVFRLEQNYRSTKSILLVADQLISNNVRRKAKTLFTDNQQGVPVRLVCYQSPESEASDIADAIALSIQKGDRKPSDFAILYRANYLSRVLEHAFRRRGIPFQILRGFEFYQRKEIKDLLGYLHLINNPADGIAFERVINVPGRSIGKVTIDRIRQFANEHQISMFEAAEQVDSIAALGAATKSKVKKFVDLVHRLIEVSDRDVPFIISSVLEQTGYRDWLAIDGGEEGQERVENVDELINAAEEFERDFDGEGGLELYLEQASLVSDTDALNSESEYVTMMTMHAAKGLEYPMVYIVGLEEGLLPHEKTAHDEDQVEEERRLLFVGITRAESELQLSRCMNRFRRGSHWPVVPSRFLMELPRHEMAIFEPSSRGGYQDWDSDVDDLDSFADDGLPSYDIHAEIAGLDRPTTLDHDHTNEIRDDRISENVGSYTMGKPSQRLDGLRTQKFPNLMTGTELADRNSQQHGDILKPDRLKVGSQVVHDEYGIGAITEIDGQGKRMTATIQFPGMGKKRFKLAYAKLRSV